MAESAVVAQGLSGAVVGAAVATAVGAVPALVGLSDDTIPTGALYDLGWPAFGVVAALLLDRDTSSRVGRAFAGFAVLPALISLAAILVGGRATAWSRIEHCWRLLGIAPVVAALSVIAWGVGFTLDRMSHRRLAWLVVWSGVLVAAVLTASSAGPRAAATTTTLGLWGIAALAYQLATFRELRPVDEPLMDLAIAAAVLLFGAGVGTLVRAGALRAGAPGPDVAGVFAAIASALLVSPAGLWLRRRQLTRRYGLGTLSAADVQQITADLQARPVVRDLLDKAAAMVAAASGHRKVGLVLGSDSPEAPGYWALYPLVVGGDRVGTLYLEPAHPEGPEPRQERIIQQLLPTAALLAQAVSLAIAADHARQDVTRQRDIERARILGDLHDGLGPVLAGMGFRVQAELRQNPTPLLHALADQLTTCRTDLRRIVSGLTPSVLDKDDLRTALHRLVSSYAGRSPIVTIESGIDEALSPQIAAAVYRSVAEGVTNALRHARAEQVCVDVRTKSGLVMVDVRDDGTGSPITPGVGLSSLQRRAEELGGTFCITADRASGTRLHLQLPTQTGAT